MPTVTIDGRTVEVAKGTNLIDAGNQVGVQIPHYCYHPRLSVVGQCRMCLVKVDGMRGLQPGCTTQVMKDGMVVSVDDDEVKAAQDGMMEFFLINHPLDCPICDQAGECGLQDYSFKHGQAFSRFRYEEKRTYPGRERIPLGPNVVLNMNRCIQCTRCVRFTQEITKTGELGFFQRGARAEIGVFPGKELDNDLSTCVVDICPVGALTSTRFRFAERVWYLDKQPSICGGCDAGCNITIEHRRGKIRRYKPRFNAAVNDYWMCDHGRASHERYADDARLTAPSLWRDGQTTAVAWQQALAAASATLVEGRGQEPAVFLAAGFLTSEEAFVFAQLARRIGAGARFALREDGPERFIPTLAGGVTGRERSPNRRGVELAGMVPEAGAPISLADLLDGDGAERAHVLWIADSDPGSSLHQPERVERLRRARHLVVIGWARTPLTEVADVVLPIRPHAEKEGTLVNSDRRIQRLEAAFPGPTGVRDGVEVLTDVLGELDRSWKGLSVDEIFARLAETVDGLGGETLDDLPVDGLALPGDGEGR